MDFVVKNFQVDLICEKITFKLFFIYTYIVLGLNLSQI